MANQQLCVLYQKKHITSSKLVMLDLTSKLEKMVEKNTTLALFTTGFGRSVIVLVVKISSANFTCLSAFDKGPLINDFFQKQNHTKVEKNSL